MRSNAFKALGLPVTLLVLFISAQYNFLLFHSVAEFFSIIVGCAIFMFAWNTKNHTSNDFFLFLGIAFLFVALFDLAHTLSYRGMGVFPGHDANLPTQLWIIARYLESISLLISPLFLTRKLNCTATLVFFALLACLVTTSLAIGVFPNCFLEGSGLTYFKIISEYVISTILLGACFHFSKNKSTLNQSTYHLLIAALILTMISELSFTFYISVYGTSNLGGHILKIISLYLIYQAVIVNGLQLPYKLLKDREIELQRALEEVKTLRGIVPICMHCKKNSR